MHDIYGTEIYVNHHREMLTQEAEQERKSIQARRAMMNRENNRPSQIEVPFKTRVIRQLRIEFY